MSQQAGLVLAVVGGLLWFLGGDGKKEKKVKKAPRNDEVSAPVEEPRVEEPSEPEEAENGEPLL